MEQSFLLEDTVLHLDGAGPIGWALNEAPFWSNRDRIELATGQTLSVFSYDTTWNYQERHPDGEELAFVLDGDIDLLLDNGDSEQALPLRHRNAGLIPAGTWHRVAVHQPSTIMFITPAPARTQHRTIDGAKQRST